MERFEFPSLYKVLPMLLQPSSHQLNQGSSPNKLMVFNHNNWHNTYNLLHKCYSAESNWLQSIKRKMSYDGELM